MIAGERWETIQKSNNDSSLNQAEARVTEQGRLTQDVEGEMQKTWDHLDVGIWEKGQLRRTLGWWLKSLVRQVNSRVRETRKVTRLSGERMG